MRKLLIILFLFASVSLNGQSLKVLLLSSSEAYYISNGGLSTANSTIVTVLQPYANVGDLLILHVGIKTNATITTPTGWTLVGSSTTDENLNHFVFEKTATSTEPISQNVVFNVSGYCAGIMYSVGTSSIATSILKTGENIASGQASSGTDGQLVIYSALSILDSDPSSQGTVGWEDIIDTHTLDNGGWAYMGVKYSFTSSNTYADPNQIPYINTTNGTLLLQFNSK